MKAASVKLRKHLTTVTAPVKPARIYFSTLDGASGEIPELHSMSMSGPKYDIVEVTSPTGLSYRNMIRSLVNYGDLIWAVGLSSVSAILPFFDSGSKVLWTVESDRFDIEFDGYVTEIDQSLDGAQIKVKIVGPVKYYYDTPSTQTSAQLGPLEATKDIFTKKASRASSDIYASMLAKVLEQPRESVIDQIRAEAEANFVQKLGRNNEEIRAEEEAEDYRYDD